MRSRSHVAFLMRAATLLVAMALAITRCDPRSPLQRLAGAARKDAYRTSEGRLCGFEFRPFRSSRRESRQNLEAPDVELAARNVVTAAERSIDDQHARAVALLLLGKHRQAVAELERAVASGRGARGWSDLAAAQVAVGRAARDPHAFAEALAAADRALAMEPAMPEALFNRAIALRAMQLKDAAIGAFERYRAVDSTSGWSEEASAAIGALRAEQRSWHQELRLLQSAAERRDWRSVEAIARRHPEQARTWGEVEFLGEWGSRTAANDDAGSHHYLQLARVLGGALLRRNSEGLLRDAVAVIDAMPSPVTLAQAHKDFRHARRVYANRKNAEAVPLFESAAEAFRRAGSPMWLKARRYHAAALHDVGRSAEGLKMIADLQRRTPRSYPALQAELLWQQGTIQATQGLIVESIDSYKRASVSFLELGEIANGATVKQMLAGRYQNVGARTEAWESLISAFAAMSLETPDDLQRALSGAARGELAEEHWEIARSFLDVARDLELIGHNARREAFIWTQRATAGSRVGAPDFAADLMRARAAAARIPDEQARAAAMFDIRFVEASAVIETDSVRADAELTSNIEWATRTQYMNRLPEQYLERCRARLRLRRPEMARSDLLAALEIVRSRGRSLDSFGRAALMAAVDRAVDEVAGFFVAAGDPQAAFEIVERAAANVIGRPPSTPTSVHTAPAGVTYIRYRVIADRVLMFALDASGLRVMQLRRPRADVQKEVDTLLASIRAGSESLAAGSLTRLHDLLIAPVHIGSRPSRLIIAPDASLANVPFAALRNRSSGRALVEDYAVACAWGASALAPDRLNGDVGTALVVSNPTLSPRIMPSLPSLPQAEAEGRELATLLGANHLAGHTATARAVRELMPRASIFHFAGHAVENVVDGRYSYLALATNDETSGLLYLRDIEELDLRGMKAAVLAACRTSVTAPRQRHPLSLSAAFLAAGAHSVVGTLWDVDDAVARRFSVRFHQRMAAGDEPVDAARYVQLEMLAMWRARPDARFQWVSFQIWIG